MQIRKEGSITGFEMQEIGRSPVIVSESGLLMICVSVSDLLRNWQIVSSYC